MFSVLESVAFDTGYAGSAGLVPQSWVNGNGTSYIYFGAGEFDGQGSGHDYFGTVSSALSCVLCFNCLVVNLRRYCLLTVSMKTALHAVLWLHQQLRWWPLPHLLRLPPAVNYCNELSS